LIVYTHSPYDLNQDHRVVSDAVMVAVRRRESVGLVYGGEGDRMQPGFAPTLFLSIDGGMLEKVAGLRCYKSELRQYPDPRSESGVCFRGGYWAARSRGRVGAEAFELLLGR
jgi:N-acetylglucosamine malate deacetylase 1